MSLKCIFEESEKVKCSICPVKENCEVYKTVKKRLEKIYGEKIVGF